jgi:hypothetical protein
MKRAELGLSIQRGLGPPLLTAVGYDDVAAAKIEYDRLTALLKKREDRGNDLELVVELKGDYSEFSCALSDISSIALVDFQKTDESEKGLRDAFPHIRWLNK